MADIGSLPETDIWSWSSREKWSALTAQKWNIRISGGINLILRRITARLRRRLIRMTGI